VGSTSSNGQITSPTQHDYSGWKLADRYEFIRVLGTGGSGTVYLANDLLLPRQVAVKTILPALADNSEVRRRIDRECRLHATIGVHPNIVTLYDKLEQDSRIYLVMEYFRGKVLADMIPAVEKNNQTGFSVDTAICLVRQVLLGIACIHAHGILHRDIKTSNILVQQRHNGEYLAKLMDFGIARQEENNDELTRLTQLDASGPGTPVYMAPERIDPHTFGELSPATDLYSVGVILYQLLSDGPPFRGSITEIFNGHLAEPVDLSRLRQKVSQGLRDTIKKALAKDADKRFSDAESFAAALDLETEIRPHSSPNEQPDDNSTLTVITYPAQAEIESTVLAPEPGILKTQAPGAEKTSHYLKVLLIAALCAGVFLVSAVLFFKTKSNNITMQNKGITTHDDIHPETIEKTVDQTFNSRALTNSADLGATALETLQTSRAREQTAVDGGSNIENMLEQNKTITGESEWQVLESSARRIDR
jgi:serine/threonine-protein kinase